MFLGGAPNTATNYIAGSYNHYRGRDSRSSWDGSSNSSKKGGGNYNHHNNPVPGNPAPVYQQPLSTTVPSIMNIPSSSVTGFISPQQYYSAGQSSGFINNGAKSETAINTSQLPTQSTSGNNIASITSTGAPSIVSPSSPSGQMSVQIEKVAAPGSNLISAGSVPAGSVQNASSAGSNNPGNVIMQSQSASTSSNQSPSKPAVSSVLPIQTVSVIASTSGNVPTSPIVVSTLPQATAASPQSSNAPAGSHSSISQRPTRGVTDDSNSSGGYHGHSTGYYQNYHQKSSIDASKDGQPV